VQTISESFISASSYAKARDLDPQLLLSLIRQYKIKADARSGRTLLFKPERLDGIVEALGKLVRKF